MAVTVSWSLTTTANALIIGSSMVVGSTQANGSPSTINTGDIVVLFTDVKTATTDPGAPSASGYTLLDSVFNSGEVMRGGILYKVAGVSEPNTVTVSWAGTVATGAAWGMMVFAGADGTTPIDGHSVVNNTGTSTDMTATTISPAGAANLLVGFWCQYGNNPTYAVPASMTQRLLTLQTSGVAPLIMTATEVLSASGATGDRLATQGAGSRSLGFMFSLAPAGAAPTARRGGLLLMGVG